MSTKRERDLFGELLEAYREWLNEDFGALDELVGAIERLGREMGYEEE